MTKANVSISRIHSNTSPDKISIKIEDGSSGAIISIVEMPLENFSKVITGQAYVEAEQKFTPTERTIKLYGKKQEIKEFYMTSFAGTFPSNDEMYKFIKGVQMGPGQWVLRENGKSIKQGASRGWRMLFERYADANS